MFKFSSCFLALCPIIVWATETLHPIYPPATTFSTAGVFELIDDIYSVDATASLEFAPFEWASIYVDGSLSISLITFTSTSNLSLNPIYFTSS